MELLTLTGFCVTLLVCILTGQSLIYALLIGLALFNAYGLHKGFTPKQMAGFCLSGVKTVKNILLTFLLIGMLTALWRDSGTIAVIVCYASRLIHPSIFLLMTFLLNCLLSVLTGTSFGTAATMGVICATMGSSLGVPTALTGGAVLAGAFFGDRCSPVSTSALLTAALTETDIFRNIRNMIRTALVPLALSCLLYAGIGFCLDSRGAIPNLAAIFGKEFVLSPVAVLPAAVLLVLSVCRVPVKPAMLVSILTALPISVFVQHTPWREIPAMLCTGFAAEDASVAARLNGGGVFSMVRVTAIVCISSAYAGIFRNTGLLTRIQTFLLDFAGKTTPFAAILLTSVLTGIVSCNQTLAIMLTHQLTGAAVPDKERFAVELEDSAVVVAPLIPWSIAGAVPLTSIGAPMISIAFAFFLYLLPLWRLAVSFIDKKAAAHG